MTTSDSLSHRTVSEKSMLCRLPQRTACVRCRSVPKKGITGRLRDVACAKIDEQTEALVEIIGENQIDYRFFLGFKLLESKISRRFQFRRLDKNNFGYLLEHIYGNTGIAYNDYSYELPVI